MQKFKEKIRKELYQNIIPFWKKLIDTNHGGFFGYVDNHGKINDKANKGAMLQLRILWFFSYLYKFDNQEEFKLQANHAFKFVTEKLMDQDGTILWESDYQGKITDFTKHIYYQSFGIYAISQYYDSFKDSKALDLSNRLFDYIETHYKDANGYIEQLDSLHNRLADNGIKADRTMNSLLHLLEAYSTYYKITNRIETKEAIESILDLFINKIYNPKLKRLEVLFNHQMESIADYHSYGHDIEASWLLDDAADAIKNPFYQTKIYEISDQLCTYIDQEGFINQALKAELIHGKKDDSHIWWMQAEAIVGFYKNSKRHKNQYMNRVFGLLDFILQYQINQNSGEWYWKINKDLVPDLNQPLVSNWKCPYHNGRMCIELLKELRDE